MSSCERLIFCSCFMVNVSYVYYVLHNNQSIITYINQRGCYGKLPCKVYFKQKINKKYIWIFCGIESCTR